MFNDFGPKFACVDPTGEQALTGMIVSVEKVSNRIIAFRFMAYHHNLGQGRRCHLP